MKEQKTHDKTAKASHGKLDARPGLYRKPSAHPTIIYLCWILTSILSGAFEGTDLFRTIAGEVDGIFPPVMNSPASLPDHPIWLTLGRGQPLGQPWAAYSSISVGGQLKTWRAATGIWSSGDKLYRETSLTTALAKQIPHYLRVGFSLAYHKVTIDGFDPIKGELLMGAALSAPLSEDMEAAVWYGGQVMGRKQAYESLSRQLFQLAVTSRIGDHYTWALAVEKTPGYALRQVMEVSFITWRELTLQLGYRTEPGIPYGSAHVPIGRLLLSVRLNYHPIFGPSTAFGVAFK